MRRHRPILNKNEKNKKIILLDRLNDIFMWEEDGEYHFVCDEFGETLHNTEEEAWGRYHEYCQWLYHMDEY